MLDHHPDTEQPEPQDAPARVMIVDRDEEAVKSLSGMLSKAGFQVTALTRGEDALAAMDRSKPHLVMLDWELPGVVAINVIRRIQYNPAPKRTRLMALSLFSGEEQVVSGFEIGADAYVVKPYSLREVVARVKAILRPLRHETESRRCLQFKSLRMNVTDNRLTVGLSSVSLRPMEFRLLEYLMQHPERAFGRQHLLEHVWGHDVRADARSVDVNIQRIRKVLEPHACDVYLQTVRGLGYRLSAFGSLG